MARKTQNKNSENDNPRTEEADATQRDLSRGGLKPSHDELGHELNADNAHSEERKRNNPKSPSIGGPGNQSGRS